MKKAIPIISTIVIMVLVSTIPGALADTITPPLTPGFHIWHGSPYIVCPAGVPAPCAGSFPSIDYNNTFWKEYGSVSFISHPLT